MNVDKKYISVIKSHDYSILKEVLQKERTDMLDLLSIYRPDNQGFDLVLKGKINFCTELLELLSN